MGSVLEGIRIVDFGQYLAAPLAAMLLCDSGAEVIRIDPPGGPRWKHPANAILQRGKRSIVLDLRRVAGAAVARHLIGSADVVIEGFRPGTMKRLGLGPVEMTAANPRLIYCSIPGFGEDDPRAPIRAWEGIVCTAAGLYDPPSFPGYFNKGEEPVYTALPLASSYAAFIAAHSLVAALIARERYGCGQCIEVPLFDACFEVTGFAGQSMVGKPASAPRLKINLAAIGRYQCADDRWIDLSPPLRGFKWFAGKFLPKEANDSGLTDVFQSDPERVQELRSLLTSVFKTRSAAEWERVANQQSGNGIAACQTSAEWLRDDHARASGCVVAVDDPELGPTWQAGFAVSLSKTPMLVKRPRPPLSSDRESIVAQIWSSNTRQGPAPKAAGPPLAGIHVIDTTQVLAGPTACRILAEYGAEVIKINDPHSENPMATMAHLYVNNGKRSILLDLKSPVGRNVVERLIKGADVFHQNFRRGTAERLGLGEADLRRLRPELIYSSINCHAEDGFRASYRGHEELGQAVTGMEVRAGGGGVPERLGWPICDLSTGHLSAFGILLALFHRMKTGEGQRVHAALSRSGTFLQIPFMIDYPGQVWDEPRGQNAKGWGPLYRLYRARDRWLFLAAHRDGDLQRLGRIAGLEGIEEIPAPRLGAHLESRFASAPADEWIRNLGSAGLSAHVLVNHEQNMESQLSKDRGLSVVRNHPAIGEVRNAAAPAKLSRTPLVSLSAAPPLGWHAREILEEIGYGSQFQEFLNAGVVGTPPLN
jgi:crotonobetainyl-CoA:carnitine CoA-transferase CaiB-like acyl-CoA transferase